MNSRCVYCDAEMISNIEGSWATFECRYSDHRYQVWNDGWSALEYGPYRMVRRPHMNQATFYSNNGSYSSKHYGYVPSDEEMLRILRTYVLLG